MSARRLYHFTCSDAAPGILRERLIKPMGDWAVIDRARLEHGYRLTGLGIAPPVAWFTSAKDPARDAVGLTSHMLSCDRMEFRFTVRHTAAFIPWERFAARWGAEPDFLAQLMEDGGDPSIWWVATRPVPYIALRRYQGAA